MLSILLSRFVSITANLIFGFLIARNSGPEIWGRIGAILSIINTAAGIISLKLDAVLIKEYHLEQGSKANDQVRQNIAMRVLLAAILSPLIISEIKTDVNGLALGFGDCLSIMLLVGFQILDNTWLYVARLEMSKYFVLQSISYIMSIAFVFSGLNKKLLCEYPELLSQVIILIPNSIPGLRLLIKERVAVIRRYDVEVAFKRIQENMSHVVTRFLIGVFFAVELHVVSKFITAIDLSAYRFALQCGSIVQGLTAVIPMAKFKNMVDNPIVAKNRTAQRQENVIKWSVALFGFMIVAVLGVYTIGQLVIVNILGDQYKRSLFPIAIIVLGKIVSVPSGLIMWRYWANGKDKTVFKWQVLCIGVGVLTTLLGAKVYGINGACFGSLSYEVLTLLSLTLPRK